MFEYFSKAEIIYILAVKFQNYLFEKLFIVRICILSGMWRLYEMSRESRPNHLATLDTIDLNLLSVYLV